MRIFGKFNTMIKRPVTRREILHAMAVSGCMAGIGMPVYGAAGNPLEIRKISDRITLVSGAGGNVAVFRGDNGLTVIDSGSKDHVEELLAVLREIAEGVPVLNLFNTHWHEDHTGGNEAFHALGANIIAHENTRLWLDGDFDVEWRNWHHDPRPAAALPDITFYESGERDLDNETVQYLHYPQAHTDGDIVLYFPVSNVMVTGGLMSDGSYPMTDIATGGWIGGLIPANEAMLEIANEDTIIIPDRGPARTKADLQAQFDMLNNLYTKMKAMAQQGLSGHNMLEEKVTAEYDARWGDPTQFILETYRGMWAHTYDMGGFI